LRKGRVGAILTARRPIGVSGQAEAPALFLGRSGRPDSGHGLDQG